MDLKSLFNKGKKMVDDRGGVDSLKEDAQELAGIAKGKGSLTDKAKEAAAAVKDPGTNEPAGQHPDHQNREHRAEPEAGERHPNRDATRERHADADRQESKERRHP
jgi:hypothetical protein